MRDLAVSADRLCRFVDRYNQTERPFDWRFTRSDLAGPPDPPTYGDSPSTGPATTTTKTHTSRP